VWEVNANEYQRQAMRTLCDQEAAHKMMDPQHWGTERVQLLHAMVGLQGEAGEVASLLQKLIWYRKGVDIGEVAAELGDILWYVAEACDALELSMGTLMEQNLAKLKARYPEKWSQERADHANRDDAAEKAAATNVAHGTGKAVEQLRAIQNASFEHPYNPEDAWQAMPKEVGIVDNNGKYVGTAVWNGTGYVAKGDKEVNRVLDEALTGRSFQLVPLHPWSKGEEQPKWNCEQQGHRYVNIPHSPPQCSECLHISDQPQPQTAPTGHGGPSYRPLGATAEGIEPPYQETYQRTSRPAPTGHGPFGALSCETGDHLWTHIPGGSGHRRGCKECGIVEDAEGGE
jgi:NTP pyrophosphatase (non-canonical NTP hydrolase)